MWDVMGVVLGGGRGDRLYPLTKLRSKPAVPLGTKYRLIDIPISNCLNSQINRIFVLTQFNSASLNKHIVHTYKFDMFSGGFVDILAAEQTPDNSDWFQGTADAVRQSIKHIEPYDDVKYVIILSGDQLYQMDFRRVIEFHIGVRSRIGGGTTIKHSLIMGADYFETVEQLNENAAKKIPNIGIGHNCTIINAIIDKNVRIGDNVSIINAHNQQEKNDENYCIRDGIIVVPKGVTIRSGTVI